MKKGKAHKATMRNNKNTPRLINHPNMKNNSIPSLDDVVPSTKSKQSCTIVPSSNDLDPSKQSCTKSK